MMRTFLAASGTALVIVLTMTAAAFADEGDALVAGEAFHAVLHMTSARQDHTATLLPDGKVLLAGGRKDDLTVVATAELFDPATSTSTAVSMPMVTPRVFHTATLLRDGKVLLIGGDGGVNGPPLNTAELYDPAAGTFTATGSMITTRRFHTATLLPDGMVLVVGGAGDTKYQQMIEVYDPATGTFSAVNAAIPALAKQGHPAAERQSARGRRLRRVGIHIR
jgi:hypothetical protein